MNKELLDIVQAQGKLTEVHLMVASGQLCGAAEAIDMYSEMLCVETEDFAKKTRQNEESGFVFVGEGGLVCHTTV